MALQNISRKVNKMDPEDKFFIVTWDDGLNVRSTGKVEEGNDLGNFDLNEGDVIHAVGTVVSEDIVFHRFDRIYRAGIRYDFPFHGFPNYVASRTEKYWSAEKSNARVWMTETKNPELPAEVPDTDNKSTARIRATVQLRETPQKNAQVTESLGAGMPVEVLNDQGAWLQVKASRSTHAIPGWVQKEALAFPLSAAEVFPVVKLATGKKYSSVPFSLKSSDVESWKSSAADKPAWIPDTVWGKVAAGEKNKVKDGIRSAIQARQAEWDAWLANVVAEGRKDEAVIEEWLATLHGGQEVWSVRPEMIYTEASQERGHLGWVRESDIMHWTGKVKKNDQEPKYKIWYEVSLLKSDKLLKGWFKGVLIEPYVYPSDSNDTAVEANKDTQFDLSQTTLRHPADPEIQDAIDAKRAGYQYIDIINALGKSKIHHNLCGEFCAAALAGVDVIPLLNKWKVVDPKAVDIMRKDEGTGLPDIKTILSMYNLKFEEFRYTPSVSPVSPVRLLKLLDEGRKIFWGVAIFKSNGKLSGTTTGDKTTRHWIVLEDVIPVGNSGWVRIYNPFRNREEVYGYDYFIQSVGQFGIGLLVDAP